MKPWHNNNRSRGAGLKAKRHRVEDGHGAGTSAGPLRSVASFAGESRVAKYYAQRRSFFPAVDGQSAAELDELLRVTPRSWFEASPFNIAAYTAERIASLAAAAGAGTMKRAVVDGFCGVGVNSIALALRPEIDFVIAIDLDGLAVAALESNATVYGVAHKVVSITGDIYAPTTTEAVQRLCTSRRCAVFAANFSPPWGGPEYIYRTAVDVTLPPFVGPDGVCSSFHLGVRFGTTSCALFVPRNALWQPMARQAQQAGCGAQMLAVSHSTAGDKVKGVTVFTGALSVTTCEAAVGEFDHNIS
jgi:predicted RNA methylase